VINGVDASNVNGSINWPALTAQHNLSFAFLKATEGRGFRDPLFPAAWKEIGTLGLVRGCYHFGRPLTNAQAQADAFLAYVKAAGLTDRDLLALDLEVNDDRTASQVAAWAQEFCAAVHAGAARKPLVYTFESFAQEGYCAGLGGYPLWIASWNGNPGHPVVPAPWKTWAVHQYSSAGLDMDVAGYADKAAMIAALGAAGNWTEALVNTLPTLKQGDADKAGTVQFVHRMQALVKVIGDINKLPAASAVGATGTFDKTTQTGVLAIQKMFGLTQDGTVGPKTWAALVAGQHA
jgi:lysozyme